MDKMVRGGVKWKKSGKYAFGVFWMGSYVVLVLHVTFPVTFCLA
jgi:hypothetical protein